MNQNQEQQPSNTSTYLDQIAPQVEQKPLLRRLRPIHMILGGIVLVLLIILVISIVNTALQAPATSLQRLSARLNTTATLAENATSLIKSSELRSINSNLKIYLTNTRREITEPFRAAGANTEKTSDAIIAAESGTEMAERLEDARLNAVFDRTYTREMTYQLDTLLTLMKKNYESTGNSRVKTTLATAYNDLLPIQEAFSKFDADN